LLPIGTLQSAAADGANARAAVTTVVRTRRFTSPSPCRWPVRHYPQEALRERGFFAVDLVAVGVQTDALGSEATESRAASKKRYPRKLSSGPPTKATLAAARSAPTFVSSPDEPPSDVRGGLAEPDYLP
jgi:hypothetical protein